MSQKPSNPAGDSIHSRARTLLDRAARMQELHGSTQQAALAGMQAASLQASPDTDTVQLLQRSAQHSIHDAHVALQQAAREAHRRAKSDPMMIKLNAQLGAHLDARPDIVGPQQTQVVGSSDRADQVVDVVATEIAVAGSTVSHRTLPVPKVPASSEPAPDERSHPKR